MKANEPGDPFSDMFIPGNQRRNQGNTAAIWVMEAENPAMCRVGKRAPKKSPAPLVAAADMTLDFILDERVRELIGEKNRRLTLMRTKTLVERALRLNRTAPINPITGLTQTHLLLPIPLSEIQRNRDAGLVLNPGYH